METLIDANGELKETAHYDVLVALYDSFIDKMYDKEKWDNSQADIKIGDINSYICGKYGFMNLIITFLMNDRKPINMNISNHASFLIHNNTFMVTDKCKNNYDWLEVIFSDLTYTSPKIMEFRELQEKYRCRFEIKRVVILEDKDEWYSSSSYYFSIIPLNIREHL